MYFPRILHDPSHSTGNISTFRIPTSNRKSCEAPFIFYQPSQPVTFAKPLAKQTREEIRDLAEKNSSSSSEPSTSKRPLSAQPDQSPSPSAKRQRNANKVTDSLANPVPALPPTITATSSTTNSLGGASVRPKLRHYACEAWYYCKGCNTQAPPVGSDLEQLQAADRTNLESRVFRGSRRPDPAQFDRLLCLLCWLNDGIWKTWTNGEGVTTRLREHLDKNHTDQYRDKCREEGVVVPTVGSESAHLVDSGPAYSNRGLEEYIAQWAAVDDQAMSVVDHKEFRKVVLFASRAPQPLCESDIPHRTKLTKVSSELYQEEMARIKQELAKTLGRVSVTSDLWSDDQFHSFMAVTLHYINGLGDLAEHLYAFRRVKGSHAGANVGRILYGILEDAELVGKIGHVTLDNASTNDTLMAELEVAFNDKRSPFEKKLNRVRCFPHVINLVVQAIINALPAAAHDFWAKVERCGDKLGEMDSELIEYLNALESNPVNVCRDSVRAMRGSDSRRSGLHDTIQDGNIRKLFKTLYGEVIFVPLLELLRDCETRWSSTYDMITRYLELYPAVALYACQNPQMSIPVTTHKQFEVLQDIRSVLSVLHQAQELLSAEKTPTLALALPVYEALLDALNDCIDKFPELCYAIECGINKLSDYITRTRDLPVYTLAMAINPVLKFKWSDQSRDSVRRHRARLITREAMLVACQKQHRYTTTAVHPGAPTERASQAQAHGFKRLLTVSSTINRASRSLLGNRTGAQANTPKPIVPMSKDELLALHMAEVDAELLRWENYEWAGDDTMGTVNIVEFWKAHRQVFPLLYQVAMDILPVQASSVSSERAFSSAKLTCTRERNQISAEHMEELQVLKHSLHRRRADDTNHQTLDFMANIVDPGWNKTDCDSE